jgi:hypothetical protein
MVKVNHMREGSNVAPPPPQQYSGSISKKIHELQDMAHARKMKTISKDTIFFGKH